jgi:hypothetical protein
MARSVSPEFVAQLTKPRQLVARVDIIDADRTPIISTNPDTYQPMKVVELSVSVDETRTVRGNARCVIAVPPEAAHLVPSSGSGILSPISGATFVVSAGFVLPSTGRAELVPCGRYDIEDCTITETAAGVRIELAGEDLTGRLNVADLTEPFVGIMGSIKLDIATLLIQPALPNISIVTVPSGETSGWVILDVTANRLTEITKVLTSMGYVAFMDPDGFTIHLEPRPTVTDTPAWFFDEDSIRVITSLANNLARRRVYNGVVASGENVASDLPPVRASAWVTDPTDPTHYDPGPPVRTNIGPRPYFETSPYIVTTEQAQNAANAQLVRLRGLLQQVTLRVGINPAANVGDVIVVARPGVGVVGHYVIQALSFDLAKPDQMELVCEERRVSLS